MTSTADLEPAQLTQECGQLKERIVELEGRPSQCKMPARRQRNLSSLPSELYDRDRTLND